MTKWSSPVSLLDMLVYSKPELLKKNKRFCAQNLHGHTAVGAFDEGLEYGAVVKRAVPITLFGRPFAVVFFALPGFFSARTTNNPLIVAIFSAAVMVLAVIGKLVACSVAVACPPWI